jgi:hypothetical protein
LPDLKDLANSEELRTGSDHKIFFPQFPTAGCVRFLKDAPAMDLHTEKKGMKKPH